MPSIARGQSLGKFLATSGHTLVRRVLLGVLGPDGLDADLHHLCLHVTIRLSEQSSVVRQSHSHVGMFRPQSLLPDRQRPLGKLLSDVEVVLPVAPARIEASYIFKPDRDFFPIEHGWVKFTTDPFGQLFILFGLWVR